MFSASAVTNSETINQTITQASWYVLRSKPQKEESLSSQLLARGLDVFYPCLHVSPVNPRSRTVRPYFPGYLFVNINIEQVGFSEFHWVPFSLGLLAFDGIPAQVPEAAIKGIRSLLEKINAAGGELLHDLKKGDLVEIRSGPFAGYEAIFDVRLAGSERVRVLLKLLQGRAAKLEVPANLLERKEKRQLF
jgi:transcription antitermination factor NusG